MLCEGWDGPCNHTDAVKYRQRTFYTDEKSNYRILCPECQEACKEHWDEQWRDYYGSVVEPYYGPTPRVAEATKPQLDPEETDRIINKRSW